MFVQFRYRLTWPRTAFQIFKGAWYWDQEPFWQKGLTHFPTKNGQQLVKSNSDPERMHFILLNLWPLNWKFLFISLNLWPLNWKFLFILLNLWPLKRQTPFYLIKLKNIDTCLLKQEQGGSVACVLQKSCRCLIRSSPEFQNVTNAIVSDQTTGFFTPTT